MKTKDYTPKNSSDSATKHDKILETAALDVISKEERQVGRLGLLIINRAISALGGYSIMVFLLGVAFANVLVFILSDYYSVKWVQDYTADNRLGNYWVIFIIMMARGFISYIRAQTVAALSIRASKRIHTRMIFALLHSKISEFIERVPSGRILNRLTKDIDILDRDLRAPLIRVFLYFVMALFDLAIVVWATDNIFLIIPLIAFVYVCIIDQGKYSTTKSEFQRLNTISKSPIIEWYSSVLRGIQEIRVLEKTDFIKGRMNRLVEENSKNNIMLYALDSWFMTRINIWNVFLVMLPSYSYLIYRIYQLSDGEQIDIKPVVLFILNTTKFSSDVTSFLSNLSNIEVNLISVERCRSFEDIEPEQGYLNLDSEKKRFLFPKRDSIYEIVKTQSSHLFTSGRLEIEDLSARYVTKESDVLADLSISIQSGEKIGVVGRTGSGKSSLIKLFWRALIPYKGNIFIDGQDISNIDLKGLRSQIEVVSQDNAIFEGTLRENIDPHLEYSEETNSSELSQNESRLISILKSIGFDEEKLRNGLDFHLDPDGSNLSSGEKQMISFVRAIAAEKRIMILDEATASIDSKTEQLFQNLLSEWLKESTLIIIAHRIQTVLNCDRILVLKNGRIQEFDTVDNLLKNPNSEFYRIHKKLKNSGID